MPIQQTRSLVYAGAIVLCAVSVASAQRFQPLGPVEMQDDNLQIFAPAELGDFGDRPDPHQGFFFTYERFDWITSQPDKTSIGKEGFTPLAFSGTDIIVQRNSVEQSVPKTENGWGNRFEFGYLVDQSGWMMSITEGMRAGQIQQYGHDTKNIPDVSVVFADPDGILNDFIDLDDNGADDDLNGDGILDDLDRFRLATYVDQLRIRDKVEVDSVELMRMHRFKSLHRGGIVELYYGARFFKYDDLFVIEGAGGLLGNAMLINTESHNNIIGPQIGGRYSNTRERWTFSVEGRFLAGANFQATQQDGTIDGLRLPNSTNPLDRLFPEVLRNSRDDVVFSPLGELRVQTSVHITKQASFKFGWTGTYVGQIARASNQIDYSLPRLGLFADSQDTFTHGVSVGFEVNR